MVRALAVVQPVHLLATHQGDKNMNAAWGKAMHASG